MLVIAVTARANDPSCLGVHLGAMESTRTIGPDNPRLVAAVGNGEMCVIDRGGGEIEPGDFLISSDVRGCAMKDDPARFPIGHIVARAAQRVDWSRVAPDDQGIGGPNRREQRRTIELGLVDVRHGLEQAARLIGVVRRFRIQHAPTGGHKVRIQEIGDRR